MAPETSPPAWTVTQQIETTDVGPAGGYVAGVRVTFRTAENVTGSVFIPEPDYTPDRVKAAIERKAAILSTVAGLEG